MIIWSFLLPWTTTIIQEQNTPRHMNVSFNRLALTLLALMEILILQIPFIISVLMEWMNIWVQFGLWEWLFKIMMRKFPNLFLNCF